MLIWTAGMTIYAVGRPTPLVVAGLATHGAFICCFLIAGQVFVNRQANDGIRASAQGLVVLVSGSGLFAGNLLVGLIRDWTADDFRLAYLPAVVTAGTLSAIFLLGFRRRRPYGDSLVPGRSVA
jgi:hypothetical protein